ncbi:MAG: hypothetical protein KC482_01390 [Dehalococcoidia bacterium]|nr:hypothetical protein [Dehalococcoidia bacterium]
MSESTFSGLKLSEGTTGGGLDQRLFGAPPVKPTSVAVPKKAKPKPSPPAPGPSSPPPPSKPAVPESHAAPRITINGERVLESGRMGAARWADLAFDINTKPYRKDSFLFTDDEFEALEDLKLELKRNYDLPATKNDIARIALQRLYEDYADAGATSAIVSRLQRKKS